MAKFEDFKVGEHVAHISQGDGVVTAVDDSVHVTYRPKGVNSGKPLRGIYDRRWFELHPNYLFHRNTEPV